MKDRDLIEACKLNNAYAQKALYEKFAPRFFGLCKRYVLSRENAEDVLQEAMYKILDKISSYKYKGSFEGWMRRIVVNEALMFIRKNNKNPFVISADETYNLTTDDVAYNIQSQLEANDILKLIHSLPTGYRLIFNMFVIEGYKHREIADLLSISINTSKSQLILAKKKLRKLIAKDYTNYGTS